MAGSVTSRGPNPASTLTPRTTTRGPAAVLTAGSGPAVPGPAVPGPAGTAAMDQAQLYQLLQSPGDNKLQDAAKLLEQANNEKDEATKEKGSGTNQNKVITAQSSEKPSYLMTALAAICILVSLCSGGPFTTILALGIMQLGMAATVDATLDSLKPTGGSTSGLGSGGKITAEKQQELADNLKAELEKSAKKQGKTFNATATADKAVIANLFQEVAGSTDA